MDLSTIFFSSKWNADQDNIYQFIIDVSKYVDENGFSAIWFPERHFNEFGALFPNPAQLCAAVAMVTQNVRLRSGSVVLPLHHPLRLVEEWSVVDNLSNGRVDLSFTPGWIPKDFVLNPSNFADKYNKQIEYIPIVEKLWQGESINFLDGKQESVPIETFPKPIQKHLNIWITCGGQNIDKVKYAASHGYNILTALINQTIEELAENISTYKKVRAEHGLDPEGGQVSLMAHTYVGETEEETRSVVSGPFKEYLTSSTHIWKQASDKLDKLSEYKKQKLIEFAFERYYQTATLFGDKEACNHRLQQFREIGVTEIACLVDFGINTAQAINGLSRLKDINHTL